MRILVTGGTGFIGSNIVIELMGLGHEVLITGHDAEQKIPGFTGKYLQPSFVGLDFDSIGKIDGLIHQAAINDTTLTDETEMTRANVESTKALFEYVVANGCRNIVYASSNGVYGNVSPPHRENGPTNPTTPYARSKKMVDDWVMEFVKTHPDVKIIGLRYCHVYGPRENHKGNRASMVYKLARQIMAGNPRLFKHGEHKRDYLYVADVVRANLLALQAKESGIYNCSLGNATTYNNIASILCKVLGKERQIEYIENPFAETYPENTESDISLAKEKLGFVPEYDIERGIKAYYKSGFLA